MVHLLEFLFQQSLVLPELRTDILVLLTRSIFILLLTHFALFDVCEHVQKCEQIRMSSFEPADQIRVETLASQVGPLDPLVILLAQVFVDVPK